MRYYLSTDKRKRTLSDWPSVTITGLVCLLCWVSGYFSSVGFPIAAGDALLPFWKYIGEWLSHRVLAYFIGFLLIILIAFILQRISDIEMLIRDRTRLVFLFFFFLASTNVGLLSFNATTLVLLCLVFLIFELFNTYQLPEATGKLFNVGVLISMAGLLMPQVLWLIPLIWIGMYQFQSLSYRSFMASLTGVLIIYWFVLAWCVWTHDFSMFTSLYTSLADFNFFSLFVSFRYYHIGFIVLVILLLAAFFYIKMDAINNRVRVRQMLSFLLNMSFWLLILICLYGGDTDALLAVLTLPVSVLLAYFFESMRTRFRFFLYFLLLALSVFSFFIRIWIF